MILIASNNIEQNIANIQKEVNQNKNKAYSPNTFFEAAIDLLDARLDEKIYTDIISDFQQKHSVDFENLRKAQEFFLNYSDEKICKDFLPNECEFLDIMFAIYHYRVANQKTDELCLKVLMENSIKKDDFFESEILYDKLFPIVTLSESAEKPNIRKQRPESEAFIQHCKNTYEKCKPAIKKLVADMRENMKKKLESKEFKMYLNSPHCDLWISRIAEHTQKAYWKHTSCSMDRIKSILFQKQNIAGCPLIKLLEKYTTKPFSEVFAKIIQKIKKFEEQEKEIKQLVQDSIEKRKKQIIKRNLYRKRIKIFLFICLLGYGIIALKKYVSTTHMEDADPNEDFSHQLVM